MLSEKRRSGRPRIRLVSFSCRPRPQTVHIARPGPPLGDEIAMIRSILLWLLVLLFAIDTVAGLFRDELSITALGLVVLVAFVFLHGALHYGAIGIAIFAAICLTVSNVFENMGVATGFPFGPYHYTDALGPKLLHVPLMIGPAYLGVGYLAWTLSSILVGGVRRDADTLTTFATPFIAAFIMVLRDLAMDPASSTIQKLWI